MNESAHKSSDSQSGFLNVSASHNYSFKSYYNHGREGSIYLANLPPFHAFRMSVQQKDM